MPAFPSCFPPLPTAVSLIQPVISACSTSMASLLYPLPGLYLHLYLPVHHGPINCPRTALIMSLLIRNLQWGSEAPDWQPSVFLSPSGLFHSVQIPSLSSHTHVLFFTDVSRGAAVCLLKALCALGLGAFTSSVVSDCLSRSQSSIIPCCSGPLISSSTFSVYFILIALVSKSLRKKNFSLPLLGPSQAPAPLHKHDLA